MEKLSDTTIETFIYDSSVFTNDSSLAPETWDCFLHYQNQTPSKEGGCVAAWDGVSCWPPTPLETEAVVPCMDSLNGVAYDTTLNATRECFANGTWASRSNYDACRPLEPRDSSLEVLLEVEYAFIIYSIGYGLSLIALAIAVWIFLYFRDLRCLRNSIHTHLLVTYLCMDLTWIVTTSLQTSSSPAANQAGCFSVVLLTYFLCTHFFWMFVEGLYLYTLVVRTFSSSAFGLLFCAALGWGTPAVVIIVWSIVKAQYSTIAKHEHSTNTLSTKGCPWHKKDGFDYIFMGPILLVLLLNIYFLGQIMWVLITKLRAANSIESKQYSNQIHSYRNYPSNCHIKKASKALLVLIPLLGVTYIAVLVTPAHRTARVVVAYAQALLLSTQGFTVAVLYCFLNGEVRKSVRHHLEQWRDQRRVGGRGHDTGGGGYRLHPPNRDRTSCTSLTSSGTWLRSPPAQLGSHYSPIPPDDTLEARPSVENFSIAA